MHDSRAMFWGCLWRGCRGQVVAQALLVPLGTSFGMNEQFVMWPGVQRGQAGEPRMCLLLIQW